MTTPIVRDACANDIPDVLAIYGHHVMHGLASFEETPPTLAEINQRWQTTVSAGLPYLVAELGGDVIGFAYVSMYRPRSAYRYTVEDSVYIAPGMVGRGAGRALLASLIESCTKAGFKKMIAVIGDSENSPSIKLHTQLGFHSVGVLQNVGYKFERWVDTVLMQKTLG